jgi:branched-chain amino acid transport system permease protein
MSWWIGIYVLAVAASFLIAPWLNLPDLRNIVTLAGIYAIAVVGLDILTGYAGQISLGHAGFMAIGAYTSAITTIKLGWPPLIGLLGGLAINIILGLAIGSNLLKLKGDYLALATLAFSLAVQAALVSASELTGGSGGLSGLPEFSLGIWTAQTKEEFSLVVLITLTICTIFLHNAIGGRVGRALFAIHCGEVSAEVYGIPTTRMKLEAFLWSIGLASIAGSFLAHYLQFVAPGQFSIQLSIELLIMMLLGGAGTIIGSFVGALGWGIILLFAEYFSDWRTVVTPFLLAVLLLYFPGGLVGLLQLIKRRLEFHKLYRCSEIQIFQKKKV